MLGLFTLLGRVRVVAQHKLSGLVSNLLDLVAGANNGTRNVAQSLRLGVLVAETGQLRDEARTPPGAGVLEDVALELAEVGLAVLGTHGDGIVDSVGEFLGVPWVDNDTSVQRLSSAGKLAENHDTMVVTLGGDVLVRNQVHTITG